MPEPTAPAPPAAPVVSPARWDTTIARGIAALLIVNSHLERFYPIPQLADGGQIGNIGFFFISGLGLALSSRQPTSFVSWYGRRLSRIYPAVWVCLIPTAVILNGGWSEWGIGDYIARLVWPIERYHFLERIIVYYVILYALTRTVTTKPALVTVFSAVVVATLGVSLWCGPKPADAEVFQFGAVPELYTWPFYFSTMLAGYVAAKTVRLDRFDWRYLLGAMVLLGGGYAVFKYLIVVRQLFTHWHAVHSYLTLCLCATAVAFFAHPEVMGFVGRHKVWFAPLAIVGGVSLELYLIHFELLHSWPSAAWGPFPFNILAFLAVSVAASVLANRVLGWLLRKKPRAATPAAAS